MRPYGVRLEEFPDVVDILKMGCKGCVGKFAGRSGDFRAYSRGHAKATTRRYWKRQARAAGKREVDAQGSE